MSAEDYLILAAIRLLTQTPLLAVSAVGLWFARRHARQGVAAFKWATWGFALLMAYAFLHATLQVVLVGVRAEMAPQDLGVLVAVWGLVDYPLFLGGIIALGRAVFLGRGDVKDSGSSVVAAAA